MKNWMALVSHKWHTQKHGIAKLYNDLNDAADDKKRLPLPLLCYIYI